MVSTGDAARILQGLRRVDGGFRIKVVDGYAVEVRKMLFNWRLVVFLDGQQVTYEHGYCYFGTDLATLLRATAAGVEWDDPLHTAPSGFDKHAF